MPMPDYRRPSQSSYAHGSWWATHAAELIGAIAGFLGGFVILLLANAINPSSDLGWVPFLTMIVGGLGARWAVDRQFRSKE